LVDGYGVILSFSNGDVLAASWEAMAPEDARVFNRAFKIELFIWTTDFVANVIYVGVEERIFCFIR